jgi:peptide/nickel transport system substrate-binding protein
VSYSVNRTAMPSKICRRRPRLWALVAAAALATTATACGSSADAAAASKAGSPGGTHGTANTNAVLQAATPQAPVSFDPCATAAGASIPFLDLIYAPLIYSVPSTDKLVPGLASSWGFSGPNNDTFTLTLKRGYSFQDGTPVNAQAVIASINSCLSEKVQSLPTVTGITASGSYTVVFHLSAPTASLPAELSQNIGMIVSPTAIQKYGVKNLSDHPTGAGPFILTSYVPNSSVTLTRWAAYKPAGAPVPKLKRINVQIITDENSLAAALTSGTVDYAFGVDSSIIGKLKSDPNLHVHINHGALAFTAILFNFNVPPANNVDVRLAMEYGLDRATLARVVSDGVFTTPAYSIYPPGSPYYDPTMANAWPYDPAKAKKLLAAAGYPNGITINGAISIAAPPFENDAIVAAAQLKKVGITINWIQEQGPQALSQFNQPHGAPMLSVGWDGTVTPLATYTGLFSKDGLGNPAHHVTPAIENGLAKLNSTYTNSAVMNVVKQMDAAIRSQALIIPLFYNPFPEVYSSRIGGALKASSLEAEPDMDYLTVSS